MGQQTTTIATVRFFRQDDPPPSAPDGATWVTPSDGAGDDTASRYVYDAAASRWELESAVGPSEPTLGTPVAGATWRDTSEGVPKQYDGAAFVKTAVTDIYGLNGIKTQPEAITTSQPGNIGPSIGSNQTETFTYTLPTDSQLSCSAVEIGIANSGIDDPTFNSIEVLDAEGNVLDTIGSFTGIGVTKRASGFEATVEKITFDVTNNDDVNSYTVSLSDISNEINRVLSEV